MAVRIKIVIIRLVQICLFFVPLKQNRIMFYANNRKGYVCNPAFLMEAIRKNYAGEYELIWMTRFPETCEQRDGVTVVRQRSFACFKYFIRTKYIITNDMIDEAFVKKAGQIFVSTWHGGGAYKKVGISALSEDAVIRKNFQKWYGRLDYFVSSCRICTDMYAEAFGLPKQCFLETGTPRNDIFFCAHEEISRRVRNFYEIPEQTKILLFAPSFQMSAPEKEKYDKDKLVEVAVKLQETTKTPWVILYRSHYLRDEETPEAKSVLLDGNAYYEMQDLLYASDVLVTDFSSCIWDFSLTGRPVLLLEERLEEYKKEDRGFFVPYETWPYLKIRRLDELAATVTAVVGSDYSSVYEKHREEMGSFETGSACQQIINTVLTYRSGKRHERTTQ